MTDLRRRLRLSALALLLPLAASAQTATLVRDIVQGERESTELGSFRDVTALPGRVFFSAIAGAGGNREMWASDGTAEGTHLLKDVCPGPCSSEPRVLGHLAGDSGRVLLWAGRSNDGRFYLWRSDGTRAGTFRLGEEPIRWNGDSDPLEPAAVSSVAGGFLYVLGEAGSVDALWRTDGTRAGTQVVRALPAGHVAETLLTEAGKVFFTVRSGSFGDVTWTVWASDGTAAGTVALRDLDGARPLGLRAAAGHLFFVADHGAAGEEMWASDGTAAGTRPVTGFAPAEPFGDSDFSDFLRVWVSGGRFFFAADDVVHGDELYESDGTPAGTRRITDFGIDTPGFRDLAVVGGAGNRVVFTANDGLGRAGVWVTTGDPAGTRFQPLPCGDDCRGHGDIRAFVKVGPRVVVLMQANFGLKILSTDGTPAGSRLLRGCANGCDVALPQNLPAETGALPFITGGIDALWITDGTPAGTRRRAFLRERSEPTGYFEAAAGSFDLVFATYRDAAALWALRPGGGGLRLVTAAVQDGPGTYPYNLAPLGDDLAFNACESDLFSLWRSAGTAAATAPAVLLAEPSPGTSGCWFSVELGDAWSLGSKLAFLRETDFTGREDLWASDGTPAGTVQLTPPDLGVQGRPAVGNGRVYFNATHGETVSLWASDGTPAGTVQLAVWPLTAGGPTSLTPVGNELYFYLGGNDTALWKSDGTPAGTVEVVANERPSTIPPAFTRLGPAVYFVARGTGFRDELWRTDGTAAGTRALGPVIGMDRDPYPTELTAFGGSLYFFAWVEREVRGLWRSDGTAAGTTLLATFLDSGGTASPAARQLTAAAGRLFFVASDGTGRFNTELWVTDGTPAGTRIVRDINPGRAASGPDELTAAGGRLYFAAAEETHGRELWTSDGTAAGTRLVQDIAPFGPSSEPADLTVAGGRLYFTADDGVAGRELWSLPLAGPAGCQPSATRLCLNGGRYQVEAAWLTGDLVRGFQTGHGTAVPLTGDTGTFWFFDAANVEVVVKVLDGRPLNGHVWVFYGALSDVDYTLTVTDTQTGLTRRYHNPQGRLASIGDTQGFGPLGAFGTSPQTVEAPASPPLALELVAERVDPAAAAPCQAGPRTLCLNGNRFAVAVAWQDFQGNTGPGTAVPLTADTGTFWFFDAANVELVVKILDGRPLNGRFWLFYGALSNVEYTLTVTDTETGTIRTYRNPSGRFASVADTGAF